MNRNPVTVGGSDGAKILYETRQPVTLVISVPPESSFDEYSGEKQLLRRGDLCKRTEDDGRIQRIDFLSIKVFLRVTNVEHQKDRGRNAEARKSSIGRVCWDECQCVSPRVCTRVLVGSFADVREHRHLHPS